MLAGVHGLGPVGFGALLTRCGSGLAILAEATSPRPGAARRTAAERMSPDGPPTSSSDRSRGRRGHCGRGHDRGSHDGRIRELGLRVVTIEDSAYPLRLAAIDMPPHVLYVLGGPGRAQLRRCRRDRRHRRATEPGSRYRGPDRRGPRGHRRASCRAGGRHRRTSRTPRRCTPWARPWPRSARASPTSIHAPTTGSRVSIGATAARPCPSSRPRSRRSPLDLSAAQPIISGLADATVVVEAPAQRRPDHCVVGARAGSRLLPRPARSAPRPRPAALPSCVSSRTVRGSSRVSRSSSTISVSPIIWPSPGVEPGGRHACRCGACRGPARPGAGPRTGDGGRARCRHGLARRQRSGRADLARTARPGGRHPWSVPARGRPRAGRSGHPPPTTAT